MQDSGVSWLGHVPSHWTRHKLRGLLDRVAERNRPDLPLLSVVREKGVILRDISNSDDNHNFIPDDLSNYKHVRSGQFAMNKMKAWQGSYGVSDHEGIVSPAYFVFDLRGVEPQFFHVAIRSRAYVPFFTQASDGVRVGQWDLSDVRMREIPFFVPPPDEQKAIVRFLGHADQRIRRYMRAKQKLIKLLVEQKQAVIHRAVTRGFEGSVRLKPSGVDWLGDMPEHWTIAHSKRTFGPRKELARSDDIQLSATQAFGVIPQDEYERRIGRRIVKIFRHLEKRRHVELNDFVISMRSFQGGLERAFAAGCIRSSYVVVRPLVRVDVGYFGYVFKSAGYIRALQSTANFIRDGQDLNFDNFSAVDLPFPPIDEQRQIAEALDVFLSDLVRGMERATQEVDLLREYRIRLLTDVITGKLDVREEAAGLPELIEESDSLNDVDSADPEETREGLEASPEEAEA